MTIYSSTTIGNLQVMSMTFSKFFVMLRIYKNTTTSESLFESTSLSRFKLHERFECNCHTSSMVRYFRSGEGRAAWQQRQKDIDHVQGSKFTCRTRLGEALLPPFWHIYKNDCTYFSSNSEAQKCISNRNKLTRWEVGGGLQVSESVWYKYLHKQTREDETRAPSWIGTQESIYHDQRNIQVVLQTSKKIKAR